jgi:hypothetical protein
MVVCVLSGCRRVAIIPGYDHRLSWQMTGPGIDPRTPAYVLDGRPIGKDPAASSILDALPVTSETRIHIDLPRYLFVSRTPLPYDVSDYFPKWLAMGAHLDYYVDGVHWDVHTLTWSDFMEKGEYKKDPNAASWILDGRKCGGGEEAVRELQKLRLKTDSILQIVAPPGYDPPFELPVSAPEAFIDKQLRGKVHIFQVIPRNRK